MHIVFFEFVTNFGGARRSTIETAARLTRRVQVTVVDPYGCCEPYLEAVSKENLPLRVLKKQNPRIVGGAGEGIIRRALRLGIALPDLLHVRSKLGALIREIRPDIICSNETKGMAVASSLNLCPVVGYMRGWYRPDSMVPYERFMLKHKLDHLLAVSHATRAALLCSGIKWGKISVVQNPVDVAALEEQAARGPETPLLQRERPVRILMAANCIREKGQHTAIGAMGDLVKAGVDAVLYLAGGTPFSQPSVYVEDCKQLAKRLGVSDRVVWLGFRQDVPALIKQSTIVVLPTAYPEGMPRVLLEAMALGRPVVSTPISGNTDLILDGVTGLMVEPEDPAGLAVAIQRLAHDPDEARRLSDTAQLNVNRHHSPALHTNRLLDVFKRVVKNNKH